jgi:hypothetical protein
MSSSLPVNASRASNVLAVAKPGPGASQLITKTLLASDEAIPKVKLEVKSVNIGIVEKLATFF